MLRIPVCSSCGIEVSEEAVFCPQCGSKISTTSTSGMNQPFQPKPTANVASQSKRRLYKWITFIVAFIIVFFIVSSLLDSLQPVIIIPSGTILTIQAGSYQYISFSLYRNARLTGSFNATNGINFYIMTYSQFKSYSSSGIDSSYRYMSGKVSQLVIGSLLDKYAEDQYFLVFKNDDLVLSSSVQITQAFTLTAN